MKIKIYSTTWCPSCVSAKKFFDELNINYDEVNIENEGISREELFKISGGRTVPQILINNKSIGGFSDLMILNQSGDLKKILDNV